MLNLGGPDSLVAVRPFLYNLFSDRDIIRLGPPFLQKPIAWAISTLRSQKTRKMYSLIGGKSPLVDITCAQARALEQAMNEPLRHDRRDDYPAFRVSTGMRYWHPYIEDAVKAIHQDGIRHLLAVSLYPHYSVATTGSAMSKMREALMRYPIEWDAVTEWYDDERYIDVLQESIRKGLVSAGDSGTEVLFSAHSLPLSIVEAGDPYVTHIEGTIAALTRRMSLPWHLSYQSKTGPVQWLKPTTEEKIRELAGKGVKNILVVPISFVSDHIETLYEIDIMYREFADQLGVRLFRTESFNTNPLFITALKELVLNALKGRGWTG